MNNLSILVIDDEPQMRKLLSIILESNGYTVSMAATGAEGIRMAASHPPDLILLDLGLPDQSGHDVLQELRQWFTPAILILSVKDDEASIVRALDHGANDYLAKPFRSGELLARIRSALRYTTANPKSNIMQCGSLQLNFEAHTVMKNNVILKLSNLEYNLLALLSRNEGRVLTHQFILKEIWGLAYQKETQYLRVYIGQLRKKIEDTPDQPTHIHTESGIGYRFQC
jgi:two-component system KDP operon response regulator KdpE